MLFSIVGSKGYKDKDAPLKNMGEKIVQKFRIFGLRKMCTTLFTLTVHMRGLSEY